MKLNQYEKATIACEKVSFFRSQFGEQCTTWEIKNGESVMDAFEAGVELGIKIAMERK
jgi:hypothetical protein